MSANLTLISLILVSEGVQKTKRDGVYNSDFEFKFQKQELHLAFFKTILIHIKYACKFNP